MESGPFFDSVQRGELDALRGFIDTNPALLKERTGPAFARHEPNGSTALHVAAQADQTEAARVLLDAGIELDARANDGRTALHEAVELGHADVQALLIERGAEIDVNLAAILGRHELLRSWLDADPSLANDRSTELSPLGWAAFGNQVETATELLDRGARMDDGELLCAASVGHVEVGRLLLSRGADPAAVDAGAGGNALHAAVAMKYTQRGVPFVRMLLEHPVDPGIPNARGETALAMARRLAEAQARRLAAGTENCPRPFDEVVALLEAFARE